MDKIGPYQILDQVHKGARPLYKVKAADGRMLALKAIMVEGLSAEMRERFLREAEICRTLDHPNLVRVYDAGEANGMLYQAMGLLVGQDLNSVLASGRQFTWREKLGIMEQVCEGLQYAHERHLVHRDIKPANLFLEDSGRVRVLDFGMARVAQSELTKVGSTVGTLNYMSPEQIRGTRCTAASDVFSAGIVFFQLATGRHPFSARDRSLPQVVSAIVFEAPPKLSQICPDAPEGLEFILNKALEKEPERRLQNGGDLKQALALCRITLDLGLPAAPSTPANPPAERETKTKPTDGDKTRVMAKAGAPAVPVDEQKTQMLRRDAPPAPVAPKIATPPAPPKPAPKKVVAAPAQGTSRFRYCPSCTFANPAAATICGGCGVPLVSSNSAEGGEKRTPWTLYIAVSVAVLLAIALIVVLIVKR